MAWPTPSAEYLEALNREILSIPLYVACDLALIEQDGGSARLTFVGKGLAATRMGTVHGGLLYGFLDVAGYFALAPLMGEDERAVTHDVHVSVMRPVPADVVVELRAAVKKRGRTTAFIDAEAFDPDGKLLASARVTKTITAAQGSIYEYDAREGKPHPGQ